MWSEDMRCLGNTERAAVEVGRWVGEYVKFGWEEGKPLALYNFQPSAAFILCFMKLVFMQERYKCEKHIFRYSIASYTNPQIKGPILQRRQLRSF